MSAQEMLSTPRIPASELENQAHKNPGADGAMYLYRALTDYNGSLVSQAASVALSCKGPKYQPERLRNLIVADTTRIRDATDWVNKAFSIRNLPEMHEDDVTADAVKIFTFAERMSVLNGNQLRDVLSRYAENVGADDAPREAVLRRDVNAMILGVTNDRSLGYSALEEIPTMGRNREKVVYMAGRDL